MDKKLFRNVILIIVNSITISRLIGAFALPFIYYYYDAGILSIVTLCLYFTDLLDGFLARKLKVSTFFGCLMDAFCDKILNIVSFVLLGLINKIMFIPLVLELIILSINYIIYRLGGNVQSSIFGKVKTFVLDITIIVSFSLLSLNTFNIYYGWANIVLLSLGFLTIVSETLTIVNYFNKLLKTHKDPDIIKIKHQDRIRKNKDELLSNLFDTKYYQEHKNESIIKQFYK